jgi:hypothetical protein
MIYTQADLLKLIYDTRAVSIWDHAKGPVFWYAANVPGPFYVNTEMVIGADLSARLLREITAIVAGTSDVQARAEQLETLILDAFKTSPHCAKTLQPHQSALHVSDLINNAASFFDLWQPALEKARISCAGNLCVNIRGENGLNRLREAGQKIVSLMVVDRDYFRHLHAEDLITQAVFEEIAIFFASSQDWAARYLIGKPELFDVQHCDSKSFERLKFFIAHDPWGLRPKHESFFANMEKAIGQRIAKVA